MHFLTFGFIIGGALYFLPAILGRQKHNAAAIFWLNLLLGWTVVGWVVALVWALASDPTAAVPGAYVVSAPASQIQSEGIRYCTRCGNPVYPGSRFCGNCGLSVEPLTAA